MDYLSTANAAAFHAIVKLATRLSDFYLSIPRAVSLRRHSVQWRAALALGLLGASPPPSEIEFYMCSYDWYELGRTTREHGGDIWGIQGKTAYEWSPSAGLQPACAQPFAQLNEGERCKTKVTDRSVTRTITGRYSFYNTSFDRLTKIYRTESTATVGLGACTRIPDPRIAK